MVKFVLIFLLFTPDFGGYRDVAGVFDTEAECLKAKAYVEAMLAKSPPGHAVVACAVSRPVGGTTS